MKKRTCSIKRYFSFIFMLLLFISQSVPSCAITSTDTYGLRDAYFSSPEFIAHYNYDPVDAVNMLNSILLNTASQNNTQRPLEPDIYLPMDIIMQPNYYYCGPTSSYIAISGWNGLSEVSGTTATAKINTLASQMGVDTSGAFVYRVRNCLNSYVSTHQYSYILGSTMGLGQFSLYLYGSLSNNRPPILHAITSELTYYENYYSKHYIAVEGKSMANQTITLYDSNNNTDYYGIHTVPISEAFAAIHDHSDRYLICSTD